MALLEAIRNKTGLLVAVVGIALFTFIIGDFLRSESTFFHRKRENIAMVDGEAIHYLDYQASMEERTDNMRNNHSLTDNEQYQIRKLVLNEMIDKILLFKEIKKLGLTITKDEYKDLVLGNTISPVLLQIPDFQNPKTKKFDSTALLQFLQTIENNDYSEISEEEMQTLTAMKKVWLNIKEQIIEEQLKQKLSALISSVIFTNHLEAKALYEDRKVSVSFDYVAQPYHVVSDKEVTVSDAEIRKLYNEQKNLYKQSEATRIDYIVFDITPSKSDFLLIENKLNSLREQLKSSEHIAEIVQNNSDIPYIDAYESYDKLDGNQKRFVNENSIGSVSHPLRTGRAYNLYKLEGIRIDADSIKLNVLQLPSSTIEGESKHLCDSLIQVLKEGTSFADLALEMSRGRTNGELGWKTESQLVSQVDKLFKDEVLEAKINEPTIVKSAASTFLIQVTEKTKPVKKCKIANIQIRVTPNQEDKTRLYNQISQFVSSNHSLSALKEKAKKAGFSIHTEVEVTKDQMNIDGIQNTRQIIQWAFNNKKGAISNIYECQNEECFIVAIIGEHLKEGFRSLSSVSDLLKRELINEKKGRKLIADYKIKSFKTLEQYAEAMNTIPQSIQYVQFETDYIPTIGREPNLIIKALEAPINQISGPYAGTEKVYVLYVTNKKMNQEPYDAKKYEKQTASYNKYLFSQAFQLPELLRENAKIENHFNRFF